MVSLDKSAKKYYSHYVELETFQISVAEEEIFLLHSGNTGFRRWVAPILRAGINCFMDTIW